MKTYIFDFQVSQELTEEQLLFIQDKLEELFLDLELPCHDLLDFTDVPEELTVPRLVVGG